MATIEIAKSLKLHPFTVTRLAREGKLPSFKVGGSWRFRKDQFEKWVKEQTDGKRPYTRRKQRRKVAAQYA